MVPIIQPRHTTKLKLVRWKGQIEASSRKPCQADYLIFKQSTQLTVFYTPACMYILPLNLTKSLSQRAKSAWAMCHCCILKCVLGGNCWKTVGDCHCWEMVGFVHSCVISKLIDSLHTEQVCVVLKSWTFFLFPFVIFFFRCRNPRVQMWFSTAKVEPP